MAFYLKNCPLLTKGAKFNPDPRAAPDAQVILIQPRRRGTMQKFIDLVEEDGHFQWELSEKITDEIQNILETRIVGDKMYEADIHQSLLLRLRPKKSY